MIEPFSFAVQKTVVMVDSKVDEMVRHAMYLKESIWTTLCTNSWDTAIYLSTTSHQASWPTTESNQSPIEENKSNKMHNIIEAQIIMQK